MTLRNLVVCWSALLGLLAAVYAPGLSGPFVFDDSSNIVDNSLLHVQDLSPESLYRAALSGSASGLKRPVSMLSLGVNYALTGTDPFYYKLTNLFIHLLNAALVGLLALQLIRAGPAFKVPPEQARYFALAVAAVWALHPIQVTAVFYVVQRMTSLSALFTLLGLLLYVSGRLRMERGQRGAVSIAAAMLLCLPLAVLSKDNGILMLAYIAVIELFVLARTDDPAARRRAYGIAAAIVVTSVAATTAFLAMHADRLADDYDARGMTLVQRLLTEGRALGWYLRMIFLPDLSQLGLVHDDWVLSTSLFEPPTTAAAWLLIGVLAVAGWRLRKRSPALGFGIAWFLAGHALESTVIPLDLVYEHRNYLPSFGLILGAASLALAAGQGRLSRRAGATAVLAVSLILAALTASRALEWRSSLQWSVAQAQRHPRSPANQYFLGQLYTLMASAQHDPARRDDLVARADGQFIRAIELNPAMGSAQIARIALRAQLGQPIPPEMIVTLQDIVGTQRLPPATQYTLINLVDCTADGRCKIPESDLLKTIELTLTNPHCEGKLRALLYESLAGYYGLIKLDDAAAVRYAQQAVDTSGSPLSARFVLVKWLANSGRYHDALKALAELESLDALDQYAQPRLEWAKAIAERMPVSPAP